jgi:hypothetical protein
LHPDIEPACTGRKPVNVGYKRFFAQSFRTQRTYEDHHAGGPGKKGSPYRQAVAEGALAIGEQYD